jgi:hypothetical protein
VHRKPTLAALTALLLLLQALAPLSHRAAWASGAGWIEVCGAEGLRRLPAGDAPAAPLHAEEHCPLCRVADPPAVAPAPLPVPVAAAPLRQPPRFTREGIAGRPTPHDAPPRAPPAAA